MEIAGAVRTTSIHEEAEDLFDPEFGTEIDKKDCLELHAVLSPS